MVWKEILVDASEKANQACGIGSSDSSSKYTLIVGQYIPSSVLASLLLLQGTTATNNSNSNNNNNNNNGDLSVEELQKAARNCHLLNARGQFCFCSQLEYVQELMSDKWSSEFKHVIFCHQIHQFYSISPQIRNLLRQHSPLACKVSLIFYTEDASSASNEIPEEYLTASGYFSDVQPQIIFVSAGLKSLPADLFTNEEQLLVQEGLLKIPRGFSMKPCEDLSIVSAQYSGQAAPVSDADNLAASEQFSIDDSMQRLLGSLATSTPTSAASTTLFTSQASSGAGTSGAVGKTDVLQSFFSSLLNKSGSSVGGAAGASAASSATDRKNVENELKKLRNNN